MHRIPRITLSYANVVSTLALFLALTTGGAWAATKIHGKHIKNNTVTSAKIKDRSIQVRDVSSKARRQLRGARGTRGYRGYTGAKGATGTRGFSAWDEIPSGTTVTGNIRYDSHIETAGDVAFAVDLPGTAPEDLDHDDVNFSNHFPAVTDDEDATCTGTNAAPTAPAGKVCIYIGAPPETADLGGFAAQLKRRGFVVYWSEGATVHDVYLDATWAYTAP